MELHHRVYRIQKSLGKMFKSFHFPTSMQILYSLGTIFAHFGGREPFVRGCDGQPKFDFLF